MPRIELNQTIFRKHLINKMSKVSYEKLAEASRKASEDGAKHVIATLKDGKLILSGAQNLVLSLVEDAELFNRLQNLMLEKTMTRKMFCKEQPNSLSTLCSLSPHSALSGKVLQISDIFSGIC